jgi:hypothetical protein
MRYVLASEHHDYYVKEGHISFDDVLPLDLLEKAEKSLTNNGHDLWRKHEAIRSIVFHKTCAQIASELTRSSIIRIGFDQSFCTSQPIPFTGTTYSLSDLSCIQPLVCGLMIRFTDGDLPSKTTSFCPCPEKRTSILFFSPKALITFEPLSHLPDQKFLLIVYIGSQAMYVSREKDPFVHALKSFGYAFGDHLNNTTHPQIFSKQSK